MLTYENWENHLFDSQTETKGAIETLAWAYETYNSEEIVYACSFGIEGIVLIDLIHQVHKQANIVFLDTGLHFQETYECIQKVKKRYPTLSIQLKKPSMSLEVQQQTYGEELWKHNPNQCCYIRKVLPLEETLKPVKAWISGLRREQSPTRKEVQFLNQDHRFKKVKICPLIHWTWKDIWRYAHKHQLDYNILHDKGYPSIGCQPCTSPVWNEEDLRAGRWQGKAKLECGLHVQPEGS